MASATRTLNPLPFEHLEPKRFEDLVRQVAYDFRNWQKLEPTGRAGSDDGFDARGWEITGDKPETAADTDEHEEGETEPASDSRIWLIQCKREKEIGPKKLASYLAGIEKSAGEKLYGVIIAAPCDFSKQARDMLIAWCAKNAISEWALWGKADLEDLLYQPKNDHLLFAYFGISLQIRQRSITTEVRKRLAIKRKLKRVLEGKGHNIQVLLRDPTDIRYPYSTGHAETRTDKHRWQVRTELGLGVRGLRIELARYFAFVNDDGQQWDMADTYNAATSFEHDDPWDGVAPTNELREEIWRFWYSLPDNNRRMAIFIGSIPYEKIIEVDEIGDDITNHPHIYVVWEKGEVPIFGPFFKGDGETRFGDDEARIKKFPDRFRKK